MTYTANGVYNIVNNRFIKISDTQTKFINEQEFEFNGYMKIFGFLCLQPLRNRVEFIFRTLKPL